MSFPPVPPVRHSAVSQQQTLVHAENKSRSESTLDVSSLHSGNMSPICPVPDSQTTELDLVAIGSWPVFARYNATSNVDSVLQLFGPYNPNETHTPPAGPAQHEVTSSAHTTHHPVGFANTSVLPGSHVGSFSGDVSGPSHHEPGNSMPRISGSQYESESPVFATRHLQDELESSNFMNEDSPQHEILSTIIVPSMLGSSDEVPTRERERLALPTEVYSPEDTSFFRSDKMRCPSSNLLFFTTNTSDTSRMNDFLNGLDVVAENLLIRFANNATAQVLGNLLSQLDETSRSNFGRISANWKLFPALSTTLKQCHTSEQAEAPESSTTPFSDFSQDYVRPNHRMNGLMGNVGSNNSPSDITRLRKLDGIRCHRRKDAKRLLACPIKKHHEVHDQGPPCNFKGAPYMSDIKRHLAARDHRLEVHFIDLCRTCWEYIIDRDEWYSTHIHARCRQQVPQRQTRGLRVVEQWQGLYKKLFPESQHLPSPYVGDRTWEPTASLSHVNREEVSIPSNDLQTNFNDPFDYSAMTDYEAGASTTSSTLSRTQYPPHVALTQSHLINDRSDSFSSTVLDEENMTIYNQHEFRSRTPRTHDAELQPCSTAEDSSWVGMESMATEYQPRSLSTISNDGFNSPSFLGEDQKGIALRHQNLLANYTNAMCINNHLDDVVERAALMFLEEEMSEYTQQDHPTNPDLLASLIIQSVSMSQEDLDTLSERVKARVESIVETLRGECSNTGLYHSYQSTIDPSLLQYPQPSAIERDDFLDICSAARNETPNFDQDARQVEEDFLFVDQTMWDENENEFAHWVPISPESITHPCFTEPKVINNAYAERMQYENNTESAPVAN